MCSCGELAEAMIWTPVAAEAVHCSQASRHLQAANQHRRAGRAHADGDRYVLSARRQHRAVLAGCIGAAARCLAGVGSKSSSSRARRSGSTCQCALHAPEGSVAGLVSNGVVAPVVMQKIFADCVRISNIHADSNTILKKESHICSLEWDASLSNLEGLKESSGTEVAKARYPSVAEAKAKERLLVKLGLLPRFSTAFIQDVKGVMRSLFQGHTDDAIAGAVALMNASELDESGLAWDLFLPSVLRTALAAGDFQGVDLLLQACHQNVQRERGIPLQLWESLMVEMETRAWILVSEEESVKQFWAYLHPTGMHLDVHSFERSAVDARAACAYYHNRRMCLAFEKTRALFRQLRTSEANQLGIYTCMVAAVKQMPGGNLLMQVNMRFRNDLPPNGIGQNSLAALLPEEAVERRKGQLKLDVRHPGVMLCTSTTNLVLVDKDEEGGIFGMDVEVNGHSPAQFLADRAGTKSYRREGAPALMRSSEVAVGKEYHFVLLTPVDDWTLSLKGLRKFCQAGYPAWSPFRKQAKGLIFRNEMRRLVLSTAEDTRLLASSPVGVDGFESSGQKQQWAANLMKAEPWCKDLTQWQLQATYQACHQTVSIVQGSAGSGKTVTACAVVAAWRQLHPGKKVVAVAESNTATLNLVLKLRERGIRCRHVVSHSFDFAEQHDLLHKDNMSLASNVIVCTIGMLGTRSQSFLPTGAEFLVIDECNKVTESMAIMAMSAGCRRLCLIGDPYQLRPFVISHEAMAAGLGVSLMERLLEVHKFPAVILLQQMRMHSSLMEFSNKYFYGGLVQTDLSNDEFRSVPGFEFPNPSFRACLVDTSTFGLEAREQGHAGFIINKKEAEIAILIVRQLLSAGMDPKDIALIAPYKRQVSCIAEFAEKMLGTDATQMLGMGTMDAFQGKEVEVAIVTVTRNNEQGAVGFLLDTKRLNVALTRARSGLIMIGNYHMFDSTERVLQAWALHMKENSAVMDAVYLCERLQAGTEKDTRSKGKGKSKAKGKPKPKARAKLTLGAWGQPRGDQNIVAPYRDQTQAIVMAVVQKRDRQDLEEVFNKLLAPEGIPEAMTFMSTGVPICAGTIFSGRPFTPKKIMQKRLNSTLIKGMKVEFELQSYAYIPNEILVARLRGGPSMINKPFLVVAAAEGQKIDPTHVSKLVDDIDGPLQWKDLPSDLQLQLPAVIQERRVPLVAPKVGELVLC